MPISRKHIFVPNTPILLDELLLEIEQVYSLLNGTLADRVILRQNSPTNPVLIVVNTAGDLLDLKQVGVSRLKINQNQQLVSNVPFGVAPFVVESITKVTNLNASYLDGLVPDNFFLNNAKHIEHYISLLLDTTIVDTTKKCVEYIVPAGTSMSLKNGLFACDRIIDGTTAQVNFRKNGVSLANTTLQASSTDFKVTFTDLATSVAENDVLSFTIDSFNFDTNGISNARVKVKFKQNLVS